MSDVLAIIPARSGSKGIPNKNILVVRGHPLIAYSIKAALLVPSINRVIVSTDTPRYASIARKYGAEVPFLRPKTISGENSTDLEFIEHALNWLNEEEGSVPKLIVHLRPTTPLRDPHIVEGAIHKIDKAEDATALRSIHEMSNPAYKCFEVTGEYLSCICSGSMDIESTTFARQTFPKTYEPNGYVDILKSDYIIKNRKIHGDKVIAYETPYISDLDLPRDIDYLKYQIENDLKIYCDYFGRP